MKSLIGLMFVCALGAQTLPSGVQVQYLMNSSEVSGSTLTDLSGNGNNATLHGTTVTSTSISLNGSSDYISYGYFLGNSDYTVLIIQAGSANGVLWYEGNSGQTSLMRLQRNGSATVNSSGGSATFWGTAPGTSIEDDFHSFYMTRSTSGTSQNGTAGMVELPFSGAAQIGGTPGFSGNSCAALGTQSYGAGCTSHNLFLAANYAYFALWNRSLTTQELANAYAAIRPVLYSNGVYLQDVQVSPSKPSGPIWTAQGTVIQGPAQEPSVIYDTNCQLIASPCQKMLFTRSSDIAYAEAPPTGAPWTVQSTAAFTGHRGPVFVKVNSSLYYAYAANFSTFNIELYSSTNGATGWAFVGIAITHCVSGCWEVQGGNVGVYNSDVKVVAGTWYMMYSGSSKGCGVATSSDGISWTKGSSSTGTEPPFGDYGCQGPWIYYDPTQSLWYMWTGDPAAPGYISPGQNIGRYQSTVFNSLWALSSFYAIAASPIEASPGDPAIVEVNGVTYMYSGMTNPANIQLYTTPAPLLQVVRTTEGRINIVP